MERRRIEGKEKEETANKRSFLDDGIVNGKHNQEQNKRVEQKRKWFTIRPHSYKRMREKITGCSRKNKGKERRKKERERREGEKEEEKRQVER